MAMDMDVVQSIATGTDVMQVHRSVYFSVL